MDFGDDAALRRHVAAHGPVSRQPLVGGGAVTLFESGAAALDGIFAAIAGARERLLLEYYIVEDVQWRGQGLVDLLEARLRAGVSVALSYDAAGSEATDDAVFERLRRAGAQLLEFRPFSPFRKRFNPLLLNDRDHRKILVADGRVAILGGVNLSREYENPRSAGAPADPAQAYWYDCAAQIEGPPVAEIRKLFLANWRRQGGAALPEDGDGGTPAPAGGLLVRTDGSAPRQRKQLYFESLKAGLAAAESHVLIATGYFVPSHRQWRLLAEAAQRGVRVDLVLAGYSDVPGCIHAARALYGRMMSAGVRIHEVRDGVLHAKVATIDGVWAAIGSSNLDRRSLLYNNEIDAIVLGRGLAGRVEAMLRDWRDGAVPITLAAWRERSVHERVQELMARVWRRYM